MQAGKCRHHVTIIERNVVSTDTHGHAVKGDPVELYTDIPASIETLTGREAELARQITASADTKICMRWLPNITPTCAIVWNGITYNIVQINNKDQRDRELILTCSGKVETPTLRNQSYAQHQDLQEPMPVAQIQSVVQQSGPQEEVEQRETGQTEDKAEEYLNSQRELFKRFFGG